MTPNQLLCFRCMRELDTPGQICPHCGYDNRIRSNGAGLLGETILGGQYQVGRVLGRGGFGITYIGYDLNLDRRIAIKEYFPSHLVLRDSDNCTLSAISGSEEDYEKGCRRALRESRMAAGLGQIPGVVQVYNGLVDNNTVYIVMEFIDGPTLTDYMENRPAATLAEAIDLLAPVARALQTLHERKVVHRDVKPDNIMIRRETNDGVLLDFGAARTEDGTTMSHSSAVVSAGYAPPEQYNMTSMDGRIDEYALSATLLFTLTKRRPPDVMQRIAQSNAMPSIHAANPDVSPAAESVIFKGMELKADNRYPSVEAMWNALKKHVRKPKKAKTEKTAFSWQKAIALTLSISLLGGVLGYYVPRTSLWQQLFGTGASVQVSGVPVTIDGHDPVSQPPEVTEMPEVTPEAEPTPSATVTPEPTATPTFEPMPSHTIAPVQVGEEVFHEETGLTYIGMSDGTIAITNYDNDAYPVDRLEIPTQLDGHPVSFIESRAFNQCTFTSVVIPEGVKALYGEAFYYCRNLTDITIPDSVDDLHENPIVSCSELQNIYVSDNHPALRLIDGVLFSKDGKQLFTYPCGRNETEYQVPEGTTSIAFNAFNNCFYLERITLPDTLVVIAEWAFANCHNLREINLPSGVTELGGATFASCNSMESIVLPDTLTTIYDNPFMSCGSLKDIHVSDSHPTLEVYDGFLIDKSEQKLLSYCYGRNEEVVEIPEGVNYVGHDVFFYSDMLVSVSAPEALRTIQSGAFKGCERLTTVTLSEGITDIDSDAFANCPALASVNIPASLSDMADDAFDECPNLVLTVIPGTYGEQYAKDHAIAYGYVGDVAASATPEAAATPAPVDEPSSAQAGMEGMYEYNVIGDTVRISRYTGNETEVEVPAEIAGKPVTVIGNAAFRNQLGMTAVVLPDTLLTIEGSAFSGCNKLSSITIPNGVTTIDKYAFYSCTNLTNAVIPQSAVSISEEAFALCPNLTLIVTFGSYAESYAQENNLRYAVITSEYDFQYAAREDGHITITKYTGTDAEVVVPEYISGKPVTAIGSYAFSDCDDVTSVTLPGSVTVLKTFAFYNCDKLKTVTLSNGITELPIGIFQDCPALESMILPDGIAAIGSYAFSGCEKLTDITLPSSLTTIDVQAFSGCKALTDLTLSTSITSIGDGAFSGCDRLLLTVWPETAGEAYAQDNGVVFYYVDDAYSPSSDFEYESASGKLTITQYNGKSRHVYIPREIDGKKVTAIGENAFSLNYTATAVSIPYGVSTIGQSAFTDCINLKKVFLPSSVTTIEARAFYRSRNLDSITIPENVNTIGEQAFEGCESLADITLPASLKVIGTKAFSRTDLTSIVIPEGVTVLEEALFYQCDTLTSITLPQSLKTIRNHAFYNCTSLTSLTIPDEVTAIGENAFYNCNQLTEITLPAKLKTIGTLAFFNCHQLTSLTIPGSVSKIEKNTFQSCIGLNTLVLENGVKTLDENAFLNCKGLTSATLPPSLTDIHPSAFEGCINLSLILWPDTPAEDFATTINASFRYDLSVYSPAEDFSYKKLEDGSVAITRYGGDDQKVLVPPQLSGSPVTVVNAGVFRDNQTLTSISLPHGVSVIGDGSFAGCGNLKEIILPSSITTIGKEAFANCGKLTEIHLPAGVSTIGRQAFLNCSSLTSMVIPDGVAIIEPLTFADCTKLTEVTIPSSVTSIAGGELNAFTGCPDLTLFVQLDSYGEQFAMENAIVCRFDESVWAPESDFTFTSSGSGATITGYTGNASKLIIPPTLGGKKVTAIGDEAFKEKPSLVFVHLPETVTSIGYCAFYHCKDLRIINLPQAITQIEDYAFAGCEQLTGIKLPSRLKTIGMSAFNGCGLTTLTVPGTLTTISLAAFGNNPLTHVVIEDGVAILDESAFVLNRELVNLTLPDSVHTIKTSAFFFCSSLETLNLPKGIRSIDDEVFDECRKLKLIVWPDTYGERYAQEKNIPYIYDLGVYTPASDFSYEKLANGTVAITKYNKFSKEVLVPPTIEGMPVSVIGVRAFAYNEIVTSIQLPDGITTIETAAFDGCANLSSIYLPNSITSFGESAFYACGNLKEIALPERITKIAAGMFSYCKKLSHLQIPDGVTTIENMAFQGCEQLSSVTIPASVTSIIETAFHNCPKVTFSIWPDTVAEQYAIQHGIPCAYDPSVYAPGSDFTYEKNSRGITITGYLGNAEKLYVPPEIDGKKVTEIGEAGLVRHSEYTEMVTHHYNDTLTSLYLPGGITKIGAKAFSYCPNLKFIHIPAGVTEIGDGAFDGCTELTEIYLPDGVSKLGNNLFAGCINLSAVRIPDSVTVLPNNMLRGCTSLRNVELPQGITSIGTGAFFGCVNLTEITLPDGLTEIGSTAFQNCASLTDFTLPASLKTIGNYAFAGCTQLTEVAIPDGVKTIEEYTFFNCSNLQTVTLPGTVETINAYAFSRCGKLSSVTIPESVGNIDSTAFANSNPELVLLVWPGSVAEAYAEEMGITYEYHLSSYSAAKDFRYTKLPDGTIDVLLYTGEDTAVRVPPTIDGVKVTKISGISTIHNINALTSIYLPDGIVAIGDYAFSNCDGLTSVDLPDSVTTIGVSAFASCDNLVSISIPDGVTTIGHHTFFNCGNLVRVEIPDSVNFIGNSAFLGCKNLSDISIPEGITSIEEATFNNCSSLTSITIPNGVTTINKSAFYGCSSLTSIVIPDSVISIGDSAFYGCSNLQCITIPHGVASISDSVFTDCSSLADVTIPDSVTIIGKYAFSNCSSLTNVIIPDGVTRIDNSAFSECNNLSSVIIPESVNIIHRLSFLNCFRVTLFVAPGSYAERYAIERQISYRTYDFVNGIPYSNDESLNSNEHNQNVQAVFPFSVEDFKAVYSNYLSIFEKNNGAMSVSIEDMGEGLTKWRCSKEGLADLVIIGRDDVCESIFAEITSDINQDSVTQAMDMLLNTMQYSAFTLSHQDLELEPNNTIPFEMMAEIISDCDLFFREYNQSEQIIVKVAAGILPYQQQMFITGWYTVKLTVDVTDDSWSQLLFRVTVMP